MTKTLNNAPNAAARNGKSANTSAGAGTDAGTTRQTAAALEPQETAPGAAAAPKSPSKQQQLAGLLIREEGATLDEMIAATGWLPHTTRAALTGLKKKGYSISSDKVDGVRTYRAVTPE